MTASAAEPSIYYRGYDKLQAAISVLDCTGAHSLLRHPPRSYTFPNMFEDATKCHVGVRGLQVHASSYMDVVKTCPK